MSNVVGKMKLLYDVVKQLSENYYVVKKGTDTRLIGITDTGAEIIADLSEMKRVYDRHDKELNIIILKRKDDGKGSVLIGDTLSDFKYFGIDVYSTKIGNIAVCGYKDIFNDRGEKIIEIPYRDEYVRRREKLYVYHTKLVMFYDTVEGENEYRISNLLEERDPTISRDYYNSHTFSLIDYTDTPKLYKNKDYYYYEKHTKSLDNLGVRYINL